MVGFLFQNPHIGRYDEKPRETVWIQPLQYTCSNLAGKNLGETHNLLHSCRYILNDVVGSTFLFIFITLLNDELWMSFPSS